MNEANQKKTIPKRAWLSGWDDFLEIEQDTEISPYCQMIYVQTKICPRKKRSIQFSEICDTEQPIRTRKPYLVLIDKKKRISHLVNFAVHLTIEWKNEQISGEKKNKYVYLPIEPKKVWNMTVTVIPILVWAFGTVPKNLLEKRLKEQVN